MGRRGFYVVTGVFPGRDRVIFLLNFCRDRGFDVTTELAKTRRNYVATKLVGTENSTAHDRASV